MKEHTVDTVHREENSIVFDNGFWNESDFMLKKRVNGWDLFLA